MVEPISISRDAISVWVSDELVRLELVDASVSMNADTGLFGRGIGLDSVDLLRLLISIELKFDLTLEDAELTPDRFRTVGTLTDFILGKLGAQ
ncbi:MAG: acyl carrier protein [Gammaproteobacteria bacterium]|nr:acyl carrier protein [Gammaproteobacteria bacterium]MBT8444099.1 acyl carrier protein [Gammaproteobacteria bacterium]NND37933.1 acyl carrier protein [Gammaproteobacteria bacterium]